MKPEELSQNGGFIAGQRVSRDGPRVTAETVRITVRPAAGHADLLTVQDAMRQVLDIFELLSGADGGELVTWALVDATMNSPLTIEGRAIGRIPDVDPIPIARTQKANFARNIRQLRRGVVPRDWMQTQRLTVARRLMQRTVKWDPLESTCRHASLSIL